MMIRLRGVSAAAEDAADDDPEREGAWPGIASCIMKDWRARRDSNS